MTLKNNRAPLLSNIKLYASFHHHMWIQTGVTVRKRLSWVVTSVTLTFDLWPWPFAWTLRWSLVITPENFKMIRWWEHSQKGVTDRRTEDTICRAAWSQLKMCEYEYEYYSLSTSTSTSTRTSYPKYLIHVHTLNYFLITCKLPMRKKLSLWAHGELTVSSRWPRWSELRAQWSRLSHG